MNRKPLFIACCVLVFGFVSGLAVSCCPVAKPPVTSQPVRLLAGDESTDDMVGKYGHAFRVKVFVDGVYVHQAGADTHRELAEALRSVGMRLAMPVRRYDENANLIPIPKVEVQIWDTQREQWIRPDGSAMPDGRLLPLTVTVNVGNANL